MGLFKSTELREIATKVIDAGLALKREALLFAFPPFFLATLSGWNEPSAADAIKADLSDLNEIPDPLGDEIPITIWLRNASAMVMPRQSLAKFFDDMALLATERAGEQAIAAGQPPQPVATTIAVPEKALFIKTALLPDSYMTTAALRARSVARLSVTAYEGQTPRLLPSGNADGVYGTGWLIGPKHLITNWHVITARVAGEAAPDPEDIAEQVAHMKVEFDFTARDAQLEPTKVAGLVHHNPALDYAIIELKKAEARQPLPLAKQLPLIDEDHPMAANIIQHPAGEPRQFAIRNNLVAVVQGNDLAYFTDTAGGSSGSPVCDDGWRVIALHKASTAQFGTFEFQGKHTAWVNTGTLITAICDDLSQHADKVWAAIGATLV